MLKVQIIESERDLPDLFPEWERLHASVAPILPFSSPLWAATWWRHFKRRQMSAQDSLFVLALRDDSQQLVAVAPMFVSRRPGYGPIRTGELQFFGADTNVTEVRGPLCRPEYMHQVVEAIVATLNAERRFDWVQWRGLRPSGEPAKLPSSVDLVPVMHTVVHLVHMRDSWDEFRASLSRNMKEALRKCYNSLSRNNITFDFKVVEKPQDIRPAIDRFLELHEIRSNSPNSIDHANVFSSMASRAFLYDYCDEMAKRDALRIFQLVIGGRIVATRIGIVFGDELYLYYSGYDVAYGQYSIMTTVVAEAMKWAIANRFRIVNLSAGTDVSKTRWKPEAVPYFGGVTARSTFSSRSLLQLTSRLRGWRNLETTAIDPAHVAVDGVNAPQETTERA